MGPFVWCSQCPWSNGLSTLGGLAATSKFVWLLATRNVTRNHPCNASMHNVLLSRTYPACQHDLFHTAHCGTACISQSTPATLPPPPLLLVILPAQLEGGNNLQKTLSPYIQSNITSNAEYCWYKICGPESCDQNETIIWKIGSLSRFQQVISACNKAYLSLGTKPPLTCNIGVKTGRSINYTVLMYLDYQICMVAERWNDHSFCLLISAETSS